MVIRGIGSVEFTKQTDGLKAGDHDAHAYVGPPERFDLMGASQFRLVTSLGLRSHHRLLDVGCGSLRFGRLAIPYLDASNYHGIEPNQWLVDEGIKGALGSDIVRIKRPLFDGNDEFKLDALGTGYDFVVAQSILSHTGLDLLETAMAGFASVVAPQGFILATIVEGKVHDRPEGWIYPECVRYTPKEFKAVARNHGLFAQRLSWYHPAQTWFLLVREKSSLIHRLDRSLLNGAVLNVNGFKDSHSPLATTRRAVKRLARNYVGVDRLRAFRRFTRGEK